MPDDKPAEEPPSGPTELARAVFHAVGRIEAKQGAMEGKLELMQSTMEDVKTSSSVTATQSTRVADIAERREKLEIEQRTADREATASRWAWFSENWKLLAIIVIAIFAPGLMPQIMGAFGLQQAPQVVHVAAERAPAPAPVVAPAPEPEAPNE